MADIKPIETYYNGYRFRSRLEARWAVFFDALGVEYEYEPEGFTLPSGRKYLPDFRVKCYGTRGGNLPGIFPCEGCKHHMSSNINASVLQDICKLAPIDMYTGFRIPNWVTLRRPPELMEIVGCHKREEATPPFDLYIEVKGKMTHEDASKIREFSGCYREDTYGCIVNPVLIVGKIPPHGGSHDSYSVHAYENMNGIEIHPFNYETIDGDHFAAYPAAHNGKFYLWGGDSNYINDEDIASVENAYDLARQKRFEHGE